jgi:hypothetical protein
MSLSFRSLGFQDRQVCSRNNRGPSGSDAVRFVGHQHPERTVSQHLHRTLGRRLKSAAFVSVASFSNLASRCTASRFGGAIWLVYVLLTDIGRFCKNAVTSALFICKPPL